MLEAEVKTFRQPLYTGAEVELHMHNHWQILNECLHGDRMLTSGNDIDTIIHLPSTGVDSLKDKRHRRDVNINVRKTIINIGINDTKSINISELGIEKHAFCII